MAELIRAGDTERAYALAREHVGEMAGDPRFDLYYGIAAVETGHLGEAVFALERVLTQRPGADRARLELARAHFLRGDDRQARRAFETVLAHDPPGQVRAQIGRYLDAIERRSARYTTAVSGYVGLGAGYDDNVNRATSADAVDTILGTVALDEASQGEGDALARLTAGARVSHPVAAGTNLIGGLDTDARFHTDATAFNTAGLGARAALRHRGDGWDASAGLQARRFYLDGDPYRDRFGLSSRHRYALSSTLDTVASLRWARLAYDELDHLDADLALLRAGVSQRWADWPGRPTLSGGLLWGREWADDDTDRARARTDREIAGLWAAGETWLAPAWRLEGELEYRRSDYGGEDAFFDETRADDYVRVGLGLDWRPTGHWRAGPRLSYIDSDSNIALFDYDRTELLLQVRYDFY